MSDAYEYAVIISQSTDMKKWQDDHKEMARMLANGWVIQAFQAFAANSGIVTYHFLTKAPQSPPAANGEAG